MVRIKERYLLVNILYPDEDTPATGPQVSDLLTLNQPTSNDLNRHVLLKAIRAQVASLFGDCGAGATENLQVKYLSNATSTFILRISRAHHRIVRAALTFLNRVPIKSGKPCIFCVVRVSGTIRKVEREAIRRARLLMLAAQDEAAGKASNALDQLIGRATESSTGQATLLDTENESQDSDDRMEGEG